MMETVLKTIEQNKMFNEGDRVIIAVSGGPDSIALLHILNALKSRLKITLFVAHVNHCLRDDESDGDEEYVKNFCKKLNIEFRSKRVNIEKISKLKNISHESAGREERYKFFKELKEQLAAQKIAIAHNSNDQAETVLMRIMRGTGMEGLVGIKPVRDNIFVRPLINNTRYEIEKYCKENNLKPRIDKTNLQTIYARNKVRLQLIPYIQQNFNKDIIHTLNRLSDIIEIDNDYLEIIAKEKYKKYCSITSDKVIISKDAFLNHDAIITRIIRLALHNILGNLCNFEKFHIYQVVNIQKQSTSKMIMLPNNICAVNNYGNIIISKYKKQNIRNSYTEYILHIGLNEIEDARLKVNIHIIDRKENLQFNSEELVKYFDYDKVKDNIILRYRREGDRFVPSGMVGNRKLKDFFIDLKIPKNERERIPIICFNNEIAWIIGYRISECFKIDKSTKRILCISVESEEP
jgi:tRNA(Ile)-lysidine synthase